MQHLRLLGVSMAAWALVATTRQAAGNGPRILPPNASAFGKSHRTTDNVTGSATIADPLVLWQSAKITLKPGTVFVSGPVQCSASVP